MTSYPANGHFNRPKVVLLLIANHPVLDATSELFHQANKVIIQRASLQSRELLFHQTADRNQICYDVRVCDHVVVLEDFYGAFLQVRRETDQSMNIKDHMAAALYIIQRALLHL